MVKDFKHGELTQRIIGIFYEPVLFTIHLQ